MTTVVQINAPDVPPPGGHYSHAVAYGGFIYVSGQLGRTKGMSADETGDIEVQTHRALASVEAILCAAGSDRSHIIKVNAYICDIALWPALNAAYARFFGDHRPARAVVPIGPLHFDSLVEIEAVAAAG